MPISYSRRARQVYRQCQYVEIQGGRHMFLGERDRKAMEAVEKFMTDDRREESRE